MIYNAELGMRNFGSVECLDTQISGFIIMRVVWKGLFAELI